MLGILFNRDQQTEACLWSQPRLRCKALSALPPQSVVAPLHKRSAQASVIGAPLLILFYLGPHAAGLVNKAHTALFLDTVPVQATEAVVLLAGLAGHALQAPIS